MMKYAFMSFSTPELSLAGMLEAAAKYGYDGIEPRLRSNHAHGIEVTTTKAERLAARDTVAKSGIALACLATSLQFADPARTEDMVEQAHQCIDLAGDLGVPVIRVFGGRLGEGLSRQEAIRVVSESLSSLADHAAERGVAVCMETHDAWTDPTHVAAVMQQVSHPAIAVNWDIMHPVRNGNATIDESFQVLRPWIRHLHVHDGEVPKGTLMPIGQGQIDHRRAVALLKESGYTGFLSGEWIKWEPAEVHLPRELATLRRYEQEA